MTCGQMKAFALEVVDVLNNPANSELAKYKWDRIMSTKDTAGLPQIMLDLINETTPVSCTYSAADQLIDFRRRFSQAWRNLAEDDIATRFGMLTWVVRKWGNINRSLKQETLRTYVEKFNSSWMTNISNISSKSKCLAFVNPETRFVYDSRVAMLLNSILLKRIPDSKWCFRTGYGASNDYSSFDTSHFTGKKGISYDCYCRLILEIAENMKPALTGEDIQRVEFAIFSLGRNLSKVEIS